MPPISDMLAGLVCALLAIIGTVGLWILTGIRSTMAEMRDDLREQWKELVKIDKRVVHLEAHPERGHHG